jgi:lycopene cyclase-like protein
MTTKTASIDDASVLIVGAGPAALLLADALVVRGADVTLVAPAERVGPLPVYGAFADEVTGTALDRFVSRRFARPRVAFDDVRAPGGRREQTLSRTYVRIDGERLVRELSAALEGRMRRVTGLVASALVDGALLKVLLDDGRALRARVVVDASGHAPVLVKREGDAPTAFQTAYGIEVERGPAGLDDDDMLFMDWSSSGDAPATFLYAMPSDGGRWFVEETALAARPGVPLALLEERLRARLSVLGLRAVDGGPVERCVIPLDPGLPVRDQDVVPFGAALSTVHPATGYVLVESARLAPLVAARIVLALDDPNATSRSVARDVIDTVWSPARRRAHALTRYGSEILMGLDAAGIARFFSTFFASEERVWASYLSSSTTDRALARTMWLLFRRADLHTKGRMAGGVLVRDARRALVASFAFRRARSAGESS